MPTLLLVMMPPCCASEHSWAAEACLSSVEPEDFACTVNKQDVKLGNDANIVRSPRVGFEDLLKHAILFMLCIR
jgi:hypothetical protein